MDGLKKECDRVILDCKARKERLTKALIWDDLEEEQITQLASADAELMDTFYDTLGNGCVEWYDNASEAFSTDAKTFAPYISEMGDNKYLMM
jgi:hypothetical protein